MPWPFRHFIVVAAEEQAAANAIAADIDPDDGSQTFSVPLSTDGSTPTTHYGCNTASDQAMAEAMFTVDAVDPPALNSVAWWRVDAATGHLMDGNTANGTPNMPWQWEDALNALGLTRVVEDDS